jgi:Leucine-rich repeat (LRR) protein
MLTNHVKNALLSIFLVITPSAFSMTYSSPEDPQEESALCQLPQNVLFLIAKHLTTMEQRYGKPSPWRPVNRLASTCQLLDRRVNVLARPIHTATYCKRKREEMSVADFLGSLSRALIRFSSREGYNPIFMDMTYNHLADDMASFKKFLETCAQEPIVSRLKSLNFHDNELTSLPAAIGRLRSLEVLNLAINPLGDKVIAQVSTLPNLVELNLSLTDLQKIDPIIIQLSKLRKLYLARNNLKKDVLEILTQLPQLEELSVTNNSMTLMDVLHKFMNYKYPLCLYACDLERGGTSEERTQQLQQFRDSSKAFFGSAWK